MFKLSEKGKINQQMFGAIAPRYDFLNRLLSLGIDRNWRTTAVKMIRYGEGARILDVATGTGDVALEIAKLTPPSVKVTGADFCREMVDLGREKVAATPFADRIDFIIAPCEDLPFPDNTFDSTTIAFGIRNVVDRKVGLIELHRTLKKGGRLIILEPSTPTAPVIKQIYLLYFMQILPIIGGLFSRYNAYKYLTDSVLNFPSTEEFLQLMREAGFSNVKAHPLTFGIASIYVGEKN
jgi:demethylmenaquinone methyltransferase / 2-methoxy-6-polyprenyl-1,4-benzoquinol methylase